MALIPQPGTASVGSPHGRSRSAPNTSSPWGGLSSLLRPAASERRAGTARLRWWVGMSRMLRAAGANPQARPLHAVLAGGALSPDDRR
jgi:hypothetical protein